MSSGFENSATKINEVLEHIESLLLQTWQETGFGSLTIECDRPKDKKIRLIIKGGTHYRYIITDEEVKRWVAHKSLSS